MIRFEKINEKEKIKIFRKIVHASETAQAYTTDANYVHMYLCIKVLSNLHISLPEL